MSNIVDDIKAFYEWQKERGRKPNELLVPAHLEEQVRKIVKENNIPVIVKGVWRKEGKKK